MSTKPGAGQGLDKSVLYYLTRRNLALLGVALFAPTQNGIPRQLVHFWRTIPRRGALRERLAKSAFFASASCLALNCNDIPFSKPAA